MDDIDRLIAGFRRFSERRRAARSSGAREVVGAAPRVMIIACADCAADPAEITDAGPGALYVVRNLAAIVPPYAADSPARDFSAALEFGVRRLGVGHIVVLGHARCAAIGALLEAGASRGDAPVEGEFLPGWLAFAVPALARAMRPAVAAERRARICEQEAVRLSLENLLGYPWVADRVMARGLELHGWRVDPDNGALERLDPVRDDFVAV